MLLLKAEILTSQPWFLMNQFAWLQLSLDPPLFSIILYKHSGTILFGIDQIA